MIVEKLITLPKKLILISIRFYQNWLSFDQGRLFKGLGIKVCRFTPTCSVYMYQSIEKFGILKGSLKGAYRILRCNPFSAGGEDPVK
jgi:uncharacterized protein